MISWLILTYNLFWGERFKRSYNKWIRKNPGLKEAFTQTIRMLADDPFQSSLRSHSLSGRLQGMWSARITYQHRILFVFQEENEGEIILIEIGSHEEVY